jgi:hypothetical protein
MYISKESKKLKLAIIIFARGQDIIIFEKLLKQVQSIIIAYRQL